MMALIPPLWLLCLMVACGMEQYIGTQNHTRANEYFVNRCLWHGNLPSKLSQLTELEPKKEKLGVVCVCVCYVES